MTHNTALTYSNETLRIGTAYRLFLACTALALLGILIYANHLRNPFQYDSVEHIEENPALDRPAEILQADFFLREYRSRALLRMSFALNARLDGKNVLGYRLVNLTLHALNSILIFFIVRRMLKHFAPRHADGIPLSSLRSDGVALLSSMLFLAHPLQTEAVVCVANRSELLSAFFYLGGFLVFQNALAGAVNLFAAIPAIAAAIYFGFSAKQTIITLPATMALYYLTGLPPASPALEFLRRRAWPICSALALALAALLYKLLTDELFLIGPSTAWEWVGRKTYMLSQPSVIVFYYLRLLAAPTALNLDPDIAKVESAADWNFWLPFLIILGLAHLAWRIRGTQLYFFLLGWFFIVLSPSSSIVTLHDLAAEHRVYLAAFGICTLAAAGSAALAGRLSPASSSRAVIGIWAVLCFSGITVERNLDWSSRLRLWGDSAAKSPNKARPYINLGKAQYQAGDLRAAIDSFRKSISLFSLFPQSHYNLASALLDIKAYDDAEKEYLVTLKIQPGHAGARIGLGSVYNATGRLAEAEAQFRSAVAETTENPESQEHQFALLNLGEVYGKTGRLREALETWQSIGGALRDKARYNMGVTYAQGGDVDAAERSYEEALRINPDFFPARFNLAALLQKRQQWPRSTGQFEIYLRQKPGDPRALASIGDNWRGQKDLQHAAEFYRQALNADPAFLPARVNLASALVETGKPEEALAEFEIALKQLPGDPALHANAGHLIWKTRKDRDAALLHLHTAKQLARNADEAREIDRLTAELNSR